MRKAMNSKIRLILQILTLVLIVWAIITAGDFEQYCPMGGFLAIGAKIHQGTLPCAMSSVGVFMALALFIGALAIGKLFCSFLCPLGSLTEWIGKLGKKLGLHFTLPTIIDRLLRSLKYILLYFVAYYTITASELFCRKLCPFFGVGTGFGHDTVFFWALATVIITFLGALFVKQFWCKYFCFLGAASNIFVNIWGVVLVFVIYFALGLFGIKLSIAWLLGGLALVGYLIEAGLFKFFVLPFMKIKINQDKCTDCGLCTTACPYGIKVQEYEAVTHPDCIMCTECITACKKEKAVSVNGSAKLTLLPPVLLVGLIIVGFIFSSTFEFTTISERWGKFEESKSITVYKQSGLKNVNCWGSANALYRTIKGKKGIYGLDAYAKSKTVVLYYDSTETTVNKIKQALFNPQRFKTRNFKEYIPEKLSMWNIGIENLFDRVDHVNLVRAFQKNKHVFGFESHYGEPVEVTIFYNADSTNAEEMMKNIATKRIEKEIRGKKKVYEMDFITEEKGEIAGIMEVLQFTRRMFGSYNQKFNNYEKLDESSLSIYEIGMPNAGNFLLRRRMQYLVSHVSADTGVVRFKTSFTDKPVALIYYNEDWVDTTKIHQMLMADSLTYFKSDDTTGKIPNNFKFEYPSKKHSATEYIDMVSESRK